jgi:hypothetical protein
MWMASSHPRNKPPLSFLYPLSYSGSILITAVVPKISAPLHIRSSSDIFGLVVRVPGCRPRGLGFDSRRYHIS